MKVRITKAPKFKKYQALTTSGQTESMLDDPFAADNQVTQPTTVNPAFQGNAAFPTAPGNIYGTGVQNPNQVDPIQTDLETNPATKVNSVQPPPSPTQKQKIGSEKIKSSSGNNLNKVMELNAGKLALANFIDNRKKYNKKALTQRATESFHNSQPLNAPNKGTQGINSMNNFTPGMLSTIPSTGDFAAAPTMSMGAYGGQYMAYGGRVFNQVAPNALPDKTSAPLLAINKTLQPIPRDQANIEAEKDETIYFLNNGGLPAHYKIGGQPHSKGGTPLNVPEDSFVYSKALKMKDKNMFKFFDISKPTSFSEIAKKYDINKYRKILADPDTDKLQRDTAEKMIANYNLKLGMLALAQESTKGFPQGLPQVATPFTIVNAIDPEMILPTPSPMVQEGMSQQQGPPQEEMMEEPMMQPSMKFGGSMKVRIKSLPSYQSVNTSGQVSSTDALAKIIEDAMKEESAQTVTNSDTQTVTTPAPAKTATSTTPTAKSATTNTTTKTNTPAGKKDATSAKSTKATDGRVYDPNIGVIEANQDFWDEYYANFEAGKYNAELPKGFTGDESRKKTQGLRSGTKNIYGIKDWHKGEEYEDFKSRHQWYLKDHPDFNPDSKADVEAFQKAFCERGASYGIKNCYFKQKGKHGTGFDGFFGQHTWSAPGFNDPKKPTTPAKPVDSKTQEDIPVDPLNVPPNLSPELEFYPQDMWNLAAAAGQRIKRPQTWYAPLQFTGVDPAYLVPDYSPIMEAANISSQGINAYGSRQSADASLSKIQGQGARAAADHNLAVANANAGIYNNANQYNAEIANKNAMYNQQLAQTDYDANMLYEQDYIKAKNKKWSDITNLAGNMLTNAVNTANLNQLYPHYQIDPGSGGLAYFDRGEALKANKNAMQSEIAALDAELKGMGYSREERLEILKSATGSKYKSKSNDYLPDYGTSALPPGVNPYPYG